MDVNCAVYWFGTQLKFNSYTVQRIFKYFSLKSRLNWFISIWLSLRIYLQWFWLWLAARTFIYSLCNIYICICCGISFIYEMRSVHIRKRKHTWNMIQIMFGVHRVMSNSFLWNSMTVLLNFQEMHLNIIYIALLINYTNCISWNFNLMYMYYHKFLTNSSKLSKFNEISTYLSNTLFRIVAS